MQAVSENVILSDSLGYQALNARAAKVRDLTPASQIIDFSGHAGSSHADLGRCTDRLQGCHHQAEERREAER